MKLSALEDTELVAVIVINLYMSLGKKAVRTPVGINNICDYHLKTTAGKKQR
jgi:hypothetical protein